MCAVRRRVLKSLPVGAGHVRPSTLLQQPLTGRLFLSAGPGMPGPYNSTLVLEPYRQHQIDKVLAVLGQEFDGA